MIFKLYILGKKVINQIIIQSYNKLQNIIEIIYSKKILIYYNSHYTQDFIIITDFYFFFIFLVYYFYSSIITLMEIQYIRNKNFILRGSRCHGIPMKNTKLLFIRGLRSWPEIKMRRHLKKILKELSIKVLSIKRVANFNDVFFKVKIVGNEEEISSITGYIVNSLPRASINVINCSKRNHKYSFSSLKRKYFIYQKKLTHLIISTY